MKLSKGVRLLVTALVVAMALTGCMRGDTNNSATPVPTATANYTPGQSDSQRVGQAPNASAQSVFDWSNRVGEIEGSVARISEISEARILVVNNTALVGLRYNQAYQGEMTERIREMVASEVMQADPNISTVAVTSETADVDEIFSMSDLIAAGETVDSMQNDIQRIVRNATTLR